MTKAVMMIKESSASEVIDELKDVISKEPVLIKIVPDSTFNLSFGKTENIDIDLPDDQLLNLAMQAHNKDITLNEHFNNILREQIEKSGPLAFKKGLIPKAETLMEVKKTELDKKQEDYNEELKIELEKLKSENEVENAVDSLI